jgi:hypothetical protein
MTNSESRIITKRQLRTLNNKAIKNGNKALTDEFFDQLRGDLRYVVQPTMMGDFGWRRCFGFYASDKFGTDFSHVFVDMTEKDWNALPLIEVATAEEAEVRQ